MIDSKVHSLLDKLNVQAAKIEPIIHSDSLSSEVFRLFLFEGGTQILKLCYSEERFRRETFCYKHLKEIIPLAQLIDVIKPSQDFGGALLLEDIPGELLTIETLTPSYAQEMGRILARVHQVPHPYYGELGLENKSSPYQEMKNNFLKSCQECKGVVDVTLLQKIKSYVDERIELMHQAEGPCITLRDFRPGNVIANQGQIKAVIDFENAKGSFAIEDFCQFDHLVWRHDMSSREPFLNGYEAVRPLPNNLDELLPVLRVMKALAAMGFTIRRKKWQSKLAHVYYDNFEFLKKLMG